MLRLHHAVSSLSRPPGWVGSGWFKTRSKRPKVAHHAPDVAKDGWTKDKLLKYRFKFYVYATLHLERLLSCYFVVIFSPFEEDAKSLS